MQKIVCKSIRKGEDEQIKVRWVGQIESSRKIIERYFKVIIKVAIWKLKRYDYTECEEITYDWTREMDQVKIIVKVNILISTNLSKWDNLQLQ